MLSRIYNNINNINIRKLITKQSIVKFIKKLQKSNIDSSIKKKLIDEYNKTNQIIKTEHLTDDYKLEMTTKISTLIEKFNKIDNIDNKILHLNKISKNLYFYIHNSIKKYTIILDDFTYKTWYDLISNDKYDIILNFFKITEINFFYLVDYNMFMNTTYENESYTLETFGQEYIFNKIVNNKQTTITKQQIDNYKKKCKDKLKYGIIKTYTIVDFLLAIIKNKTNININIDLVNSKESLFDIYYTYIKFNYNI